MSVPQSTHDELLGRIKTLSEKLWEHRCSGPDVQQWLSNFDGRQLGDANLERLHALHLLSRVSYFGLRELRVLLRAMFRDLFRYPIIQQIRAANGGTRDLAIVRTAFNDEVLATRFLGMGNPAESGTHLLYYFRQENRLQKDLFVQEHSLLSAAATDSSAVIIPPGLRRLVFVDDLCGSGQQSLDYSRALLPELRDVAAREGRTLEIQYLVLFGTVDGLDRARKHSDFDRVAAVTELDSSYRTFDKDSRVFRKPPPHIDQTSSRAVAEAYGAALWPRWPLGFDDGQLLLAFHHNIPDNSLPILWFDNHPTWRPAFPRYGKIY